MSGRSASFSLTAAHVAQVHRAVADGGPGAGTILHTDADYDDWVARMTKSHPSPGSPTLLFAYGSLIWRPEIEHVREEIGIARGWHRSFCLRMLRFRGTPDEPGLMMALDRGGQCRGVLYELPNDDLEGQLARLFRREFTYKPPNSMPRWIKVETARGPVPALGFVMNRASSFYAGSLPLEAVAEVLARACGHVGSGAEYLLNTDASRGQGHSRSQFVASAGARSGAHRAQHGGAARLIRRAKAAVAPSSGIHSNTGRMKLRS